MTLALPLEVRRMPQRTPTANLTTSTQYAYAQTLAERIHENAWTNPSKRLNYGNTPSFQVHGAGIIPTPLIIELKTDGHTRSNVPPARIILGNETYYNTILTLTTNQFDAWYTWLQPTYNKHNQRQPPPALFRPNQNRWSRSEHTERPEQDAALRILHAATMCRLSNPPKT